MRSFGHQFSSPARTCCRLAVVLAAASIGAPAIQIPAPPETGSPQKQATPSPGSASTPLLRGKSFVKTLNGGEVHRYQIVLREGDSASVEVKQRGIDVAVQYLDSAGNLQAEADLALGRSGTERLDLVADHSGPHTIDVKPKWPISTGSYEIRWIEVRPATAADRSRYEIVRLKTKAKRLSLMDKFSEALVPAQQALTLANQSLSADDPYLAILTRDVGDIYSDMGKTADGEPYLERALQILAAKLGADQPQTIFTKKSLASTFITEGEYSKADQMLNEAISAAEKTLGRDDPMVALILRTMATLHWERHDHAQAEQEILRALAILEHTGLTGPGNYDQLLNNLGVIYNEQHEWAKAKLYFERTLSLQEKYFGPDSPRLSKTLNNLGIDARQQKDYAAAEKYYLRALAIKEKTVGPEHPEYAAVVMNLANVYFSQGNYQKALETHLRALRIFEVDLGPGEFPPIMALANVAKDYAAISDFENANRVQARLEAAVEDDMALNLALGSERQRLAYLDYMAQRLERAVSLNLQLEPGNPEAAVIAATALLQRKGRSLDATTDRFAALRKHSDPDDQVLLDQLKESSTQYARVALRGPGKQQTPEQYHQVLHDLQEKKEALENLISHHSEEFRAQLQPVTLANVVAAVPPDTALVEFVIYRPFNPKAQTDPEQWGELHYGAYILHHDSAPKSVDLGPAKDIDSAVTQLRDALRDPERSDVHRLAQALSLKVFQPLESAIGRDKRLLISPDGQLDLVPFEALADDRGTYLIERFPITYLTTGRDLLRMQVPRDSKSAPVIVADPFFGESEPVQVASAGRNTIRVPKSLVARRSVTTGVEPSSLYFAPLSGTRTEADKIHSLFPESKLLTGKSASEEALEELKAPEILHIATHGFFLEDPNRRSEKSNIRKESTDATEAENPLLRSGLALSGANLVKDGKGNGILTALEATNLDLWGTKLVTLSACDTGVGEVKNGQGVYGLRRSFVLAGAESLVMSLWPVSDYVTREIMTSYYSGLKRGLGRGDALRQAQLAMLKRKDRHHPFYWASFIQSGEWANLEGKR